jgi:hypothetical protein
MAASGRSEHGPSVASGRPVAASPNSRLSSQSRPIAALLRNLRDADGRVRELHLIARW